MCLARAIFAKHGRRVLTPTLLFNLLTSQDKQEDVGSILHHHSLTHHADQRFSMELLKHCKRERQSRARQFNSS